MGQKIHPTGFRLGTIEPWRSRWYARKKDFGRLLLQDKKIRTHVSKEFGSAGIPRIEIERTADGYVASDAGSLNGTYVNQDRIDRMLLHHGDEVQIGKFRLVFFERNDG